MADTITTVANAVKRFLKTVESAVTGGDLAAPLFTAPYVQKTFDAPLLASPPTKLAAQGLLSAPARIQAVQPHVEAVKQAGAHLANPLSPLAKSTASARADQGFCLRWQVHGLGGAAHDCIGTFAFGQYNLSLFGDGTATLSEDANYAAWTTDGTVAPSWHARLTFRYCQPSAVSDRHHSLIIFPVLGPYGEKYIVFQSAELDALQSGAVGILSTPGGAMAQGSSGGYTGSEVVYRWDETVTGTADQAGDAHVTCAGQFWLLERYDLRGLWQISKLGFWASGLLVDQPWGGVVSHPAGDYHLGVVARIPGQPDPNAPAASAPAGDNSTYYIARAARETTDPSVADPLTSPYVTFTLGTPIVAGVPNQTDTPVLWGYRLTRDAVTATASPGGFTSPYQSAEISGASDDPRREQGSVHVEDATAGSDRLAARGELTARLTTTYTPPAASGDGPQTVTLFRGYALEPHRTLKGRPSRSQGAFGASGVPAAFPSASWSGYEVALAGMWHRLAETTTRSFLSYQFFAFDAAASAAQTKYGAVPWKVTDALKYLLAAAGFPPSMIGIPDLSIRLWPGVNAGASDYVVDVNTNLASMAVSLCRSYLGRALAFDPNAGAEGQWVLLAPPPPGAVTPLWHFLPGGTSYRTAGAVVPPHLPGAMAEAISLTAGLSALGATADNTTYVIGDIESHVKPPEYNHLWAFSLLDPGTTGGVRIDNHVYNHLSYAVPGSTATPDPNSPHYVGRERCAIVGDPHLWAGAATGDYARTQQYVNYVLHRYFYASCLARRTVQIKAPLVFVKDAATHKYRPLRYYDPVTWSGQAGWFVRSAHAALTSDRMQLAKYELVRVEPYLTT